MSNRENHPHQVVVHNEATTHVWEKNSAGCTTNEGHSVYHKSSGNTCDHYGNIISRGGNDGKKH